jgi:predicted transposase YbfD/YdcC
MAPLDRLPGKDQWPGLKIIPKFIRQREVNGKTSTETACFISSLPNHTSTIAKAIRYHWGIETTLHWCLDVAFC